MNINVFRTVTTLWLEPIVYVSCYLKSLCSNELLPSNDRQNPLARAVMVQAARKQIRLLTQNIVSISASPINTLCTQSTFENPVSLFNLLLL